VSAGLILLAHGSRDLRWRQPFDELTARIRARRPGLEVRLAFLELMAPDLLAAADELITGGSRALVVVPVFFGQGGHVRDDIPALVDALRERHPDVTIDQSCAAGEDEGVVESLASFCIEALQKTTEG
jgi:sirohydrochlorin cobaltochelatase